MLDDFAGTATFLRNVGNVEWLLNVQSTTAPFLNRFKEDCCALQGATCTSGGNSSSLHFQQNNITQGCPTDHRRSEYDDGYMPFLPFPYLVSQRLSRHCNEHRVLRHMIKPYITASNLVKAHVRCCLWIGPDGLTFRPFIAGMANWIVASSNGLLKHALGLLSSVQAL